MKDRGVEHLWSNDQRHRVVVERQQRPAVNFEALIPCDATEDEIAAFLARVPAILKQRRRRKDTPP